jgi:cell division protease FtsH
MVVEFGLSEKVGPVSYATGSPDYLGQSGLGQRPYSEETQRAVDQEVARLLREAEQTAVELLRDRRGALDRLTEMLLTEETVDGSAVLATIGETALLRQYADDRSGPELNVARVDERGRCRQ